MLQVQFIDTTTGITVNFVLQMTVDKTRSMSESRLQPVNLNHKFGFKRNGAHTWKIFFGGQARSRQTGHSRRYLADLGRNCSAPGASDPPWYPSFSRPPPPSPPPPSARSCSICLEHSWSSVRTRGFVQGWIGGVDGSQTRNLQFRGAKQIPWSASTVRRPRSASFNRWIDKQSKQE